MKILILGATGLIGGHALSALRNAGCAAIGASRRRPEGEAAEDWLELDFASLTRERDWLPLLDGFDAVINCVGIIREARDGDFERLHRAAPVALFAACERLGMRRVVQVSALGSHPDAATGYWRSKGAADADLMARNLNSTIVRPSLVYGEDGASSSMFRMLATLPVLMMPIPIPLARAVAQAAALNPSSAFTPESLLMLERSADGSNTADAAPAAAMLGRPLHILSATLMFGTGFGTAFYMFFVNRTRNVAAIAVVTRLVAKADWWCTTSR